MYGSIGRMLAHPGKREELIRTLVGGSAEMPGCLSYIISEDPGDPRGIWIPEFWDAKASHEASLLLPAVQETIARARPLIAGFAERYETAPVGGHGPVSVPSLPQ